MMIGNETETFYDPRTSKIARYYDKTVGGKLGVPVSMQVALTDNCFNHCIMCDHPLRVQHKMAIESWLVFLTNMAGHGLESVCYSGGDPMAYPQFNQVMQRHIDLGVLFGMTITGYAPPYIDLSLMAQAHWVRVSLDAVTPELYAKVRGKIPVEKVLGSVEKMVEAGVPVGLHITVHQHNQAEVDRVKEWAEQHNIKDVQTYWVNPNILPGEIDHDRKIQTFEHCHASLYQLYIDAQADVYPCCMTAGDTLKAPLIKPLGNVMRDLWSDIWPRVVEYSRLRAVELPDICKVCARRLSEINYVCDSIHKGKSFF